MKLGDAFTNHPAAVGETYTQHMGAAMGFATRMLMGAFACYVHAVLPFLFVKTGSRTIVELNERMIRHRQRGGTEADARLPIRA